MEPTRDWGENRPQRPQETRSLPRRQERLEKGLAVLDECLDRLAERLDPVIGPEHPSPALAGGGPTEDSSDLGRALDHYADRLEMLTGRLGYLTDRIDL
jgi:hypothetical protein